MPVVASVADSDGMDSKSGGVVRPFIVDDGVSVKERLEEVAALDSGSSELEEYGG